MTRSRKQKAVARKLSVAEATSYVHAVYKDKSPFSGKFAKSLAYVDRHYASSATYGEKTEWEQKAKYCDWTRPCNCAETHKPERARFWEKVFDFLPPSQVPELVATEYAMPTYTEWLREKEPNDSSPYNPVIFATFYYPEGYGYSDYAGFAGKISEKTGVANVALTPIGAIPYYEEIVGSIGSEGFRVVLMESGAVDRFSHDNNHRLFSFIELINSELYRFKNAVGIKSEMITRPTSPRSICEVAFSTDGALTADEMQSVADVIREKTGAAWASVMEHHGHDYPDDPSLNSRRFYRSHFSNHPSTTFTDDGYLFTLPRTLITRRLRDSTSKEKTYLEGLPSVFSGGDIIPVGYSDCTVERDKDGIIMNYKRI